MVTNKGLSHEGAWEDPVNCKTFSSGTIGVYKRTRRGLLREENVGKQGCSQREDLINLPPIL